MFLQLGTYKFEANKIPNSWGETGEAKFSQTQIIGSKPVTQMTGLELRSTTLEILFSAEYCVPETELAKLNVSMELGEVMNLINGDGKNYGKFVITKIEKDNQACINTGTPSLVYAKIELLEYNSNTVTIEDEGLALESNEPVPEDQAIQITNEPKLIEIDISSAKQKASWISSKVKSATSLTSGMYKKISTVASEAKSALYIANVRIEATKKIITRATRLKTAISDASSSLTTLENAANIKNLSDLKNANTNVEAAMHELNGANSIVAAFIGSREGGE